MTEELKKQLQCPKCKAAFEENVALLIDDSGQLTDEQVAAAVKYLRRLHMEHR